VAKKPTTQLNSWDAKLAAMAAGAANAEASTGTGSAFLTVKKGARLAYNGEEIDGNALNVVVLDAMFLNTWYKDAFDPDNPTSPACFAMGREESDMVPHENSTLPQSDACHGCPLNEFGSAEKGRGKACKNSRRLAMILESDLEDLDNATPFFVNLNPGSLKGWAKYVKNLNDIFKRPPLAFITEISTIPDDQFQHKFVFKQLSQISENDVLGALITKQEQTESELFTPYQPYVEPPPKQQRAVRGVGRPAPGKAPAGKGRK